MNTEESSFERFLTWLLWTRGSAAVARLRLGSILFMDRARIENWGLNDEKR